MKSSKWIIFVFIFKSIFVFSQQKYAKHTISKNETISEIAQIYNVDLSELYKLNPGAVNGIKPKMILLIPNETKKNITVSSSGVSSRPLEKQHEVLPKETVYGIAKRYNLFVEDLYKVNPNLENQGLKIGQTIIIPESAYEDFGVAISSTKINEEKKINDSKKVILTKKKEVYPKEEHKIKSPNSITDYIVLPKESLYSIAKKHQILITDLQKTNPDLENRSLKAGQKIAVPVYSNLSLDSINNEVKSQNKVIVETQKKVLKPKPELEKSIPILPQTESTNTKSENRITHKVLPKESLYSIAKKYQILIADLQKTNPDLENKTLKAGQIIYLPENGNINSSLAVEKSAMKSQEPLLAVSSQIIDEDNTPKFEITHEVLPKETKYGIAKQYGITVSELEKQNPSILKNLMVGSVITIRTSKQIEDEVLQKSTTSNESVFDKDKFENKDSNSNSFADELINKASEHIGKPYRYGGTTSDGFDCSGLICYTFENSNIKLPRSSVEMANYGVKINIEEVQKGDLIFFKTNGRRRINHVGMVVEVNEDEIKFIHSSNHGGVIISSTKESYYQRNLAQINRVL